MKFPRFRTRKLWRNSPTKSQSITSVNHMQPEHTSELKRGDLSLMDFWLELNIWYYHKRARNSRNIYAGVKWLSRARICEIKRRNAMQIWLHSS